ncbi:hypothetical protein [Mesorhizobium sp.]|uniref:hypothetical protein n=1 Tax=Mesorhizobium sp. TaxID=1871066 RepID=UPI001219C9A1|nr:hypothetical protein [Mesorhizobium sp.]TIM82593.1 MAG: hypothetical protein E5Y50_28725 [Mesorhizobium sp.]
MNRLVAYLIRFAVILIGYVVAALAASAFLNIMFLASLGLMTDETQPAAQASLWFSVPFVALFVAYFAFMPAAIAILVSEFFGRRDWLFYALAGAVVAAVVGCGMVGGIFYWLSAGRWAGSWRKIGNPISPGRSGS